MCKASCAESSVNAISDIDTQVLFFIHGLNLPMGLVDFSDCCMISDPNMFTCMLFACLNV